MIKHEKTSMSALHPIISESIRDGGQFVFYPGGTSMLPTILPDEDCVILIEPSDLKKYDLVLFLRTNGSYVLHRIIRIQNGEYTIMGDNQTWTEKIAPEQVIAKVSEIRKKDGRVLTESRFSSKMTIASLYFSKLLRRAKGKLKRMLGGKK